MKFAKSIFVWIVSVVCFLSVPAGISHAQENLKTFPIGAFWPMTGPHSYYGRVMSRGAIAAVDQVNEAGGVEGYKFKLVITDFKNVDVNLCVTGLQKMISVDKIPVVLASFSPTTLASQPICEKNKVVMLNGAAFSPKLANKPYLHSLRLPTTLLIPAMLKYFWDNGARKLGLIYVHDPSGEGPAKEVLIPLWKKWGGEIVAEEPHAPGTTDFSAYLTRIRVKKPDVLYTISTGQDIAYIIKGAREVGLTIPISVIEWSNDFQAITGDTSENVYMCVEHFDRTDPSPVTQKFVKYYENKYKEETEFFAANFYDATKNILPELIKRVVKKGGNPLNGEELEAAIWDNPNFKSVYGKEMTLKRDGTVDKAMVIFKVVNGKLTIVKKVKAVE